jgi:hypothetical protein
MLLLLISGCGGSGNKEGDSGTIPTVSQAACITCHSTTLEALTGVPIVAAYNASVHNLNSVGCQDCHGAGGSHNGIGPIPFPKPNNFQCAPCHDSGTATNYPLVTEYSGSKHLGVQLEPNAPCNRCHTHQGAVLSAISHFTGDGAVMAAGVGAPGTIPDPEPIKCNTCHDTHNPKTIGATALNLRVDTAWDPSTTVGSFTSSLASGLNDQYRLCTQCHGFIDNNAAGSKLMGSGTAASGTAKVGHHETDWYRIIGTTHNQDATALAAGNITGYKVRFTLPDGSMNPNPCFDCHGHEALTNSNNDPASATYDPTKVTIYTDWAQSGHAAGLLTAKYAAAASITIPPGSRTDPARVAAQKAQVDAVMAATVASAPFTSHNTGTCSRCHATEGFSYYFENFTTNPGTMDAGVLKCYSCHTNPSAGTLRTMHGANPATDYSYSTSTTGWNPSAAFAATGTAYTLNYGKKPYPDVRASNICIFCHDSREKDPGAIRDSSTNYQRTHYFQAATTMYVKMGFITFAPGALPDNLSGVTIDTTLLSDQDGGTITSTHRKLGTPAINGDSHNPSFFVPGVLDHNGPCVACHFNGDNGNHSLKIDQRTITAVCNNCHSAEGGHDITTIANFNTYFLEPNSAAYQAALQLGIKVFNDKNTGITLAPEPDNPGSNRAYKTATVGTTNVEAGAADWTAAMTVLGSGYNKARVMGAVSNIVYLKREPGAYAHARTYSRRLLYDSIDYLDDGSINKSVSVTAIAKSAVVGSPVFGLFGKGATAFTDGTLTTLAPGTTEAMVYLISSSRTTGAWSSPERP